MLQRRLRHSSPVAAPSFATSKAAGSRKFFGFAGGRITASICRNSAAIVANCREHAEAIRQHGSDEFHARACCIHAGHGDPRSPD